jgi:hypothetical protein
MGQSDDRLQFLSCRSSSHCQKFVTACPGYRLATAVRENWDQVKRSLREEKPVRSKVNSFPPDLIVMLSPECSVATVASHSLGSLISWDILTSVSHASLYAASS